MQKIYDPNSQTTILSALQSIQFLTEYAGKRSDKSLYATFLIFELGKFVVRFIRWRDTYKNQIYITEGNQFASQDEQEEQKSIEFQNTWFGLRFNRPAKDKNEVKNQLESIKNQANQKFNLGYYEAVGDKKLALITTLPIPEELKIIKNDQKKIVLGELLYLIRPVVYCIMLVFNGSESFKPYLTSLVIDIVRFLIEFDFKFNKRSQKVEMTNRIKTAALSYLLRQPIYELLKQKYILKVIRLLFKTDGWIEKILIGLIEIRSSKSLLL
ncbi:hypothetical protein pb186bvf_006789 [Paramecium bursaria]